MKKFLLAGVFTALSLLPAVAENAADDFAALAGDASDEATSSSLGTLKWAGDQAFAWRSGVAEDPTRTGGSVDSTLSAEYKLGDWKLVGAGVSRNNEFVTGETLLTWTPEAFKVSAGFTEFSWGLADKKNPTDTLNARDYRYGADAPRLVNPAVDVTWYPADWLSVEAVYEPWKEMSQFPKDFRASTQSGLDRSAATLKASFSQLATAYPSTYSGLSSLLNSSYNPKVTAQTLARDASEPVFGGRANFFLPGVDLSLSYLYDRDIYYTPVVTMKKYATLWLPNEVDLVLKRIHRLGLNAKTTLDRYGLWLETAYNLTEDPAGTDEALRNNKLSWTTGFDFNFGPASAYYLNVQYAGEWALGYDAATVKDYKADPTAAQLADQAYMTKRTYRSLVQSLGSETEELMNTLTASLKFPLADSLVTPSLSGAVIVPLGYDDTLQTRVASAFFKPELDVMPADGVHVFFGADLAYGWVKKAGSSDISLDTSTDKLGVYTPQNNVYIKVQYKWNGSM